MSIYTTAVASGLQTVQLLGTGESGATKAAFNARYKEIFGVEMSRVNASMRIDAAISGINVANQQKVLSTTEVRLNQKKAEANARLTAAIEGVEGISVSETLNRTKMNEALAIDAIKKRNIQTVDSYLSEIFSAQTSIKTATDISSDYFGAALGALSTFEHSDFAIMESFANQPTDSLPKEEETSLQLAIDDGEIGS